MCQLCNGPSRLNAESRRMPLTEQVHNTPTSASATAAGPPSTTIVASCANAANVNMDASQFSVGLYDDFAVSVLHLLQSALGKVFTHLYVSIVKKYNLLLHYCSPDSNPCPPATDLRACQVQNGMSGSPVAVWAGASLLGR